MWIKIETLDENTRDSHILVSSSIGKVIGNTTKIIFGLREITVKVNLLPKVKDSNLGKSFSTPILVKMSHNIVDKLLIKTSNTYQIKLSKNELLLGPVIGLLLGDQQYYYHDRVMGEYTDAMSGHKYLGGLICAFKVCSINWDQNCIFGMYYNHDEQKWSFGKLPIPSVVYRRAFNIPTENVDKLKIVTNGKVFNSRRFSKWQMYKQLRNDAYLSNHLPDTATLKNLKVLEKYLEGNERIILKPTGLSRGRGICILQKVNEHEWQFFDYHDGTHLSKFTLNKQELLDYVKENKFTEKNYIIQPYLDLAKINGCPWDIRVVMQKGTNHKWECHGIECRLAGGGDLVTNISRGGKALSISQALKLSFGPEINTAKTKKEIINLCKKLCSTLEKEDDLFAEMGVDIAMDNHLNYWIIESNVRPTYNGFKKHMRYDNYLFLVSAPVAFAGSLAGFGKENSK